MYQYFGVYVFLFRWIIFVKYVSICCVACVGAYIMFLAMLYSFGCGHVVVVYF